MRALVLSAGGSFGAYQAGVWQALEEAGYRPEVVVGTSVGCLNAAAIAGGATATRLQHWWREPGSNIFRWNWPPRSPALLDNRPLRARIVELLRAFPRSEGGPRLLITVTEAPSTRIRVFRGREITADHLLACCAIPVVFAPVRVGRRWMVDGGIFCRLPLRAAAVDGATEIVAVDLLAAPPSQLGRLLLNAAIQARRLLVHEPDGMELPAGVRVVQVEHSRPLGSVPDLLRWDPGNVDRWIQAGYRDARAALPASMAQAASPRADSAAPR